jgi:hypothetical protein
MNFSNSISFQSLISSQPAAVQKIISVIATVVMFSKNHSLSSSIDYAKNAFSNAFGEKGQTSRGGLIKTVFVGIILIAVLGWVANIILNMIPSDNDTLNVMGKLQEYGPYLVMILILALFVLGVSALLRYLGVV